MMDARLAFLDTETTGLDADRHEVWEVGLILPDGPHEGEWTWQLPVDLGRADPMALAICKWYGRRWPAAYDEDLVIWEEGDRKRATEAVRGYRPHDALAQVVVPEARMGEWAAQFARLTDGRHLVGAVVSFDEKRLERLLRKHHACPTWHYHIVDVEALAAGWLAGVRAAVHEKVPHSGEAFWQGTEAWTVCEGIDHAPPWDSNALSRAVGVDPDRFDRHTALGDARWAKTIYEAVMGR